MAREKRRGAFTHGATRKVTPHTRKKKCLKHTHSAHQHRLCVRGLAPRLLAHLVEDLAVEQRTLPLALHLCHLDHIPEQVEGQVDGQRRLLTALQQQQPRRPHRLLFPLLLLLFCRGLQQPQRFLVPPLESPHHVLPQELHTRCSQEPLVQPLLLLLRNQV